MKKFLILGVLFLLPIVAYLFFSSGINNFAKLPVLTENVKDIRDLENNRDSIVSFQNKISIVAFFGNDLDALKGNTFNLDKKILEKFYEFDDFQFVIILPKSAKAQADEFVSEFNNITNSNYWSFVYGEPNEIEDIFKSFKTNLELDSKLQTPYVFIVDKDSNLRGRDDDDEGLLYGYDSRSVSELGNKMNDDIKVILAEYRLALKKYNSKLTKK
ncbi:hypothetical protein [Gillisia marina]|uniref:hypothetical protein n=1 Tax=Gillisia marina TaxID=1167637 RepID=UPI00029B3548|nr:hypothetical protein [Gillisia marina]